MVRDPSNLIVLTDSRHFNWFGHFGSHYLYPYFKSNPHDDGISWIRHLGACNVLWYDGHITSVLAPEPENPESIYYAEALGDIWSDPSKWHPW